MDTNETKAPDFIHLGALSFNKIDRHNPTEHGERLAHPITVFGLHNIERTLEMVVKAEVDFKTVLEISALARESVDVYIVRKGPQMAALGIALIKEAFNHGLSEEDHEDYGEQVRDIIGRRMLTKVEPEPVFVYGLDFANEVDRCEMRIDGVVVCSARLVQAYYGQFDTPPVIFEKSITAPSDSLFVHAVDFSNTAFFKTGTFEKRGYIATRVREATPEQIKEYLTLKFEYESNRNR